MVNFIERVLSYPEYSRQFKCGDNLITAFNCPIEARLMKTKFADLWSQHNYIFYVIDGRKIFHTSYGSYDLQKGSCVFIKKGASILENFLDIGFCVILFFIPDGFICDALQSKIITADKKNTTNETLLQLDCSETLAAFFYSMSSYFANTKDPDPQLLELKFKELILTLADNPHNTSLLSYFCSLLYAPQSVQMERVMNDNFCFNLSLEQYAKLCNRSLSSFKRDFKNTFLTTPGKWLYEKRLNHAMHLISNLHKTVSEAAFESGFENTSHFSREFKKYFGIHPSAVKQPLYS